MHIEGDIVIVTSPEGSSQKYEITKAHFAEIDIKPIDASTSDPPSRLILVPPTQIGGIIRDRSLRWKVEGTETNYQIEFEDSPNFPRALSNTGYVVFHARKDGSSVEDHVDDFEGDVFFTFEEALNRVLELEIDIIIDSYNDEIRGDPEWTFKDEIDGSIENIRENGGIGYDIGYFVKKVDIHLPRRPQITKPARSDG